LAAGYDRYLLSEVIKMVYLAVEKRGHPTREVSQELGRKEMDQKIAQKLGAPSERD